VLCLGPIPGSSVAAPGVITGSDAAPSGVRDQGSTLMSEETTDYRPMWTDLGLDLDSHDALLQAVGGLYGDTYLTQENRPEGMGYLDFVMTEVHGLRIKELDDFRKQGGHGRSAYARAPSGPTTTSSASCPATRARS
jgi:hypothetical protein